ncbi:MAG: DNA polymerase III subunit alpha [Bacilli bacterium]
MTPLFIKTDNSLLCSLIKIDDLIVFAKKHNIKSLTITDNNMYGVMEFYHKCLKNDIKPIIGLNVFDIVLYAINYNGYKNLMKLASIEEVNIEDLKKYSLDLICLVPYPYLDKYDILKDIYINVFKGYRDLEEKNNLSGNLVYLNEILYLEEKDQGYLNYLYAIRTGKSLKEVTISSKDNHLLNYQLYLDDNNELITKLCNVTIPFNQDLMPIYPCDDSFSYLKELVIIGLKANFGDKVNKIYLKRLKYELDIINKMGFCNYFLIVWDYVMFAKKNGILVGPGRGSAAGSLVAFCLGITTIDPLKYDLLFERFLNPERISMPDIDIDFEYTRREEVLNYCINKYGFKKVAPIITFGTLASKQVIRDVLKVSDISLKTADYLCKMIDSHINLMDNYKTNKRLNEYLEKNIELKKLYKISLKLEGLKRHTSIHAAGIVMSRYELDEIIPLEKHGSFYVTGYSMEYLEEIGLLKMDLLALKNLTLINDVLKELKLDFDKIPMNDKEALNIFTNVDTIGIFQFESSGMINFLNKFKPVSFEEIVACVALFRPGPMHNIDSYIKRRNGLEPIDYLDPCLVSILKPTYGIIIYQEQIMQIASTLASYSLAEADLLRKAMSKKKEDILLKEKDKFINQSLANGHSIDIATKVYNLILKFAAYGFNKAHSVSYAMIAYKMAYLKAHYKDVFMKHLLSMVIGSSIKTKEYIDSCKIKVVKPNINISDIDYKIINKEIIYPLANIKNVGSNTASLIILERNKGLFKSIFDFFNRCHINSKALESLIKAGCFDCFSYNQQTLDNNLELLNNYSELGGLLADTLEPVLTLFDEYSKQELLACEFEVFGTYISGHPVTNYRSKIKAISLKNVISYFDKNIICLILVEKVHKIVTKKNENMLFITGSDETSLCEFVLFPKNYCEVKVGNIYIINGHVEKRFDKYQIIVNDIKNMI